MVLATNASESREHNPEWMGSALNAPEVMIWELLILRACGSDPVGDAVRIAVVVAARIGLVFDTGPDRDDRSSDVCYVGDTRYSLSEKG